MTSCVHLIQQAHEKLPLALIQSISQEDTIVIMNENKTSYQSLMSNNHKIYMLANNSEQALKEAPENNHINYTQLVSIISQHDKSISW